MLKKAWKLRNKLRQKQKDKKRRSRPTTSTAPELGRHERREEDDGGATKPRTAPARVTKASSDSEDTPPDRGGEVPNQTMTWKASRKRTTNPTTTWKASHEGMKNTPKIRNGPGGGMEDPRTGGTVHCT